MKKLFLSLLLVMTTTLAFAGTDKAIEYNKIGENYYHQGDYENAKSSFFSAWSEDYNYSIAASNLGLVFMKEGNLEASIYWNEEARIRSNDKIIKANSSYNIARSFEKKGFYMVALISYQDAYKYNPKSTYKKSILRLKNKSFNTNVASAQQFNSQGLEKYKNKNYEQAIVLFKKSLVENEMDGQIWSNLAISYSKTNNFYGSQQANMMAIMTADNDTIKANSYYNLGKLYEKENTYQLTLAAYSSYLNANKYRPKAVYKKAVDRMNNKMLNN